MRSDNPPLNHGITVRELLKRLRDSDIRRLPAEAVETDPSLRRLIGRVCGHYLYHEPQLREARRRLGANVDLHRLLAEGADGTVKARVKSAIAFYVSHLRLDGVTAAAPTAGSCRTEHLR